MRYLFLLCSLLTTLSFAQPRVVRRMSCHPGEDWSKPFTRVGSSRDYSGKPYRVPVVLMTFADQDFSEAHPKTFYDRLFNEHDFSLNGAVGSVADYFRHQSGGRLDIQFDIFGPVRVSGNASSSGGINYGTEQFREAVSLCTDVDFSVYDSDADGSVDQVVIVYAGYGGNELASICTGRILPNTYTFSSLKMGSVWVSAYTASNELWSDDSGCGLGVICHEFSHSLGLPDLYDSHGNPVLDEWDLMDGGCYTNNGWTPVNFSAYERYLMGWLTPTELETAQTVSDMPALNDVNRAYLVRNDGNQREFYVLENRQQVGWDAYLPGKGLLVTHVIDHTNNWGSFANYPSLHHVDYIHADGRDYDASANAATERYGDDGRSNYLKGTAYPYGNNDCLSNSSSPAATLYYANSDGQKFMSKPITNIRLSDDGLLSFDFSIGDPSAIRPLPADTPPSSAVYDLQGNRLPGLRKGLNIVGGKKVIYGTRK